MLNIILLLTNIRECDHSSFVLLKREHHMKSNLISSSHEKLKFKKNYLMKKHIGVLGFQLLFLTELSCYL